MGSSTKLRHVLARRIGAFRGTRHKSVVQLAAAADVSPAHLYDVLNAKKAASVDFIEKVARALRVEPWQLLRDESDEIPARDSQSEGSERGGR